ncbi:MAG: glycine cleavage system protein GcvH [Planctomycetaceae bacterium]|nr:glycine cleavage system protein GcvH [Planctomycetaceae bacterium]
MSQDLLYSKTHEWVRLANEPAGKTATVGLTSFALEMLTDLVHVELPPVGREVKAGQPFGEIESVKAVSDLYSPVNGQVVEINSALAGNLEHLPEDPYGNGWFIKIKLAGDAGLSDLLNEAAYKKQCEEEQH